MKSHLLSFPTDQKPALIVVFLVYLNTMAHGQDANRGAEKDTPSQQHSESIDFVREIQPILRDHCYACHAGANEEGGLNLGIRSKAMQGGDSDPAIVAGKSHESLLIQLVSGGEKDRPMPPEGKRPLSKKQIRLLRDWIDQGARWPDNTDVTDPKLDRAKVHWAFQRLRRVDPPPTEPDDQWSTGPIDRFILRQLHGAGLRPSQPASPRTLVRRLYFDLTGLPPNSMQIDQFLLAYEDDSASAVQNLVDALLDSPRYGERWGRHWLDVARYADSDGQESDQDRPHAYTYRDFVIEAFNDNMPYDQFVRWQIAGDEFEPEHDAAISATGFLTAGPSFKLPDSFLESERLRNRYNELDDVISTLGSGLLGLTVACARCHDHKYDAFSAKEYYQLLGVFHSGDRTTAKLPSGKEAYFFRDFDNNRRTTWLFRRSDFYDREIEVEIGFPALLSSGAGADDYLLKAKQAYRQFGDAPSTLQRRALAEWITDTGHGAGALLARVIVNRIWHHHFGHALVRTTSDFGVRGDAPSHPELLEYLTRGFVENGWNIKSLHRQILTSSVWQQASSKDALDPRGPQIDPTGALLWRMKPQRLEAEVMRDAMLAVSGTLNIETDGPGFKPYIAPEANLARNIKGKGYPKDAKDDATTRRRSVYMFHKRLIPYPMFQAFDRPALMTSCARRQNTTVAPQAMVILNDRFVRSVAHDFATRLIHDLGSQRNSDDSELPTIIESAFELSLARLPTESEFKASLDFIKAQRNARTQRGESEPRTEALTDFCQSLFGLNEFIYVD